MFQHTLDRHTLERELTELQRNLKPAGDSGSLSPQTRTFLERKLRLMDAEMSLLNRPPGDVHPLGYPQQRP